MPQTIGTQLFFDRLAQPEPELLQHIPGVLFRPDFSVQSSLARPDIGLSRLDKLGPLEDLPENVQEHEDGNADIGNEEAADGVVLLRPWVVVPSEDIETVEEDDTTLD